MDRFEMCHCGEPLIKQEGVVQGVTTLADCRTVTVVARTGTSAEWTHPGTG